VLFVSHGTQPTVAAWRAEWRRRMKDSTVRYPLVLKYEPMRSFQFRLYHALMGKTEPHLL
jgi:hypothetical protein